MEDEVVESQEKKKKAARADAIHSQILGRGNGREEATTKTAPIHAL